MLLSKCAVRKSKKLKFIKEQEATGLLRSLGIKEFRSLGILCKIPLVGLLLF